MNNKQYFFYYAFLGLLTFGVALNTVVVGSQHISYGEKVNVLQSRKRVLTAKSSLIEQQTAQQLSMTNLNTEAQQSGFIPVQHIVRIGNSTVVASR